MNPVQPGDNYVQFQDTQYPVNYEAPLEPIPAQPALPAQPAPPIQPYLRAILVDGSIPGVVIPIAPNYQIEPGVSMILEQNKEYSYIPAEVPKQKGKKASAEPEEQPLLCKRPPPVLVELTPLHYDNGDIDEDVPIRSDMTPEERHHAEMLNTEKAARRAQLLRHRNNISARRGRERRSNRAKLLAEGRAQALAERNYWKARAYGLGADAHEWMAMPDIERDDFVADFRVDLETLLGKQPPGGAE